MVRLIKWEWFTMLTMLIFLKLAEQSGSEVWVTTYKSLEASGIFLPVIGIEIDYKKPAKYDDVLTLESSLIEKPNIKIQFSHKIYNQEGVLLVTGSSKLVFLDKKKIIDRLGVLNS